MRTVTKGLYLLIVEDEVKLRNGLMFLCQGAGYRVSGAGTGQEALARIEVSGGGADAFDVLVVDEYMPGGRGHELVAALAARGINLPVVVMTGFMGASIRRCYAASGSAVAFLQKPFEAKEFWAALQAVLPVRSKQGVPAR